MHRSNGFPSTCHAERPPRCCVCGGRLSGTSLSASLLSDQELCSLMGVSIDSVAGVVTERPLRQLAGNAIPVPLMKPVMLSMFRAWGLL